MARETQRHRKSPGPTLFTARGIQQHRTGPEIHLGGLCRGEMQPYGRLWRQAGADAGHHPAHGRIAAAVAMIAAQGSVDSDAANTFCGQTLDLGAIRLDGGDGTAGPARLTYRRAQCRVIGQRCLRGQPSLSRGQPAQSGHLRSAHQTRARDISIRVALAQPHQDLAILEHLESPSAHRLSPRAKSPQPSPAVFSSRCPSYRSTGSYMPIREWLHYADLRVAPTCRSRPGP